MTDTLKKFFKKNLGMTERKEENTQGKEKKWITYNEWGYIKASENNGHLLTFKGCLHLVKKHFLFEQGADEGKKMKDIANAKAEVEKIDIDLEKQESLIENFKRRIEEWKAKIEKLKKEIIGIEENPSSIMEDKTSKVGLWIGMIILTLLTVYLFVFYSSASFSAFFKKFAVDKIGLANTIFDPNALSIAYTTGITVLILIITIPAVFLGLGFLIHKFQEQKGFGKFFKIGMLVLITFAFDAILAYEITEKIYNLKAENSFQDMPPYTVAMAFESVQFWLIIFAGFIVYLIWGFIFDFTMDTYDKLDVVKQAINSRKKEIKMHEQDIEKMEKEDVQNANDEITNLKQKKVEQEKIIRGDSTIIDWSGFEKELNSFTTGWTHWMTNNGLRDSFKDEIWMALSSFIAKHTENKEQKKEEKK